MTKILIAKQWLIPIALALSVKIQVSFQDWCVEVDWESRWAGEAFHQHFQFDIPL